MNSFRNSIKSFSKMFSAISEIILEKKTWRNLWNNPRKYVTEFMWNLWKVFKSIPRGISGEKYLWNNWRVPKKIRNNPRWICLIKSSVKFSSLAEVDVFLKKKFGNISAQIFLEISGGVPWRSYFWRSFRVNFLKNPLEISGNTYTRRSTPNCFWRNSCRNHWR